MNLDRIGDVDDLKAIAARRLPRPVWDFLEGAAFRERTRTANVEKFAELRFRQRVLTNVTKRNLTTTLLGEPATFPVAIGPTGMSGAFSGDGRGELHAARAAKAKGVPFTLGMLSLTPLEEVAEEVAPPWFQCVIMRDREVVRGLIERAERAGSPVLVITVTWPMASRMNRIVRNPYARIPPSWAPKSVAQYAAKPLWSLGALMGRPARLRNLEHHLAPGSIPKGGPSVPLDATATWDDIAWVRDMWPRKLVIKGIVNPDEAERAVSVGADGLVVSNHGGNQLDESAATIEMLPEVAAAVGDRIEVLMDGGVRTGQDVLKALALGARGCLLGRAHLYGLAAAREAGVAKVLQIIRSELDISLGLVGLRDVADASPAILHRPRGANSVWG